MLTSKSSLVSESYVAARSFASTWPWWKSMGIVDSVTVACFFARLPLLGCRQSGWWWWPIKLGDVSFRFLFLDEYWNGGGFVIYPGNWFSRRDDEISLSSKLYPVCHWDEEKWRKGIAREMRGKYPISKRPWLDWNQFSGDTLYSSVRHFFLYRVSFFRKSFLQFHETGETDIITLHSSPRIITFEQLEYKSKRIQDSLIPREGYIFIFEKHSIYIYRNVWYDRDSFLSNFFSYMIYNITIYVLDIANLVRRCVQPLTGP